VVNKAFISNVDVTSTATFTGNAVFANTASFRNILPSADATYNLGGPTQRWKNLYVSTSTIYLAGDVVTVAAGQLTVNGNPVLGTATNTVLGGIKIGHNLAATSGGTLTSYQSVVDSSPPYDAQESDQWFDAVGGKQYVFYQGYWVETNLTGVGDPGARGPSGPVGPKGNTGDQGISVTLVGSTATSAGLPLTGNAGDGWIVNDTGNLWFWSTANGQWEDIGQIVGPQGDPGDPGPEGPSGPSGPSGPIGYQGASGPSGAPSTVAGPSGPSGSQGDPGVNADFNYLGAFQIGSTYAKNDIVTYEGASYVAKGTVLPNVGSPDTNSTDWQLVTARGPSGPQGIQGPQGAQGNTGPSGPSGAQGNVGPSGVEGPSGPSGAQGERGEAGGNANTANFVFTASQMSVTTNDDITVVTNANTWTFGTDGALTLPYGQSIGSGTLDGIKLTTDRGTVLFGNTPEQCVPTQSSHFHIMRDDSTTVDLFFGDDLNYVKLPYDSTLTNVGVQIGTDATNLWSFGKDGTLTLPSGNTRIGNVFGTDGMLGNTGTGVGVASQGQGGYAALQWIDDPEDATSVAAVVVNSPIASTSGTVQIATGLVGGPTAENVWEFGADGTLTAPGHLLPNADLAYDLGSTSSQWRSIYVGTGTVYIGGVALGVNQDNYVTVDGNPIITVNTAGNLTIQGDVNIGTVTVSDTAPVTTTGTQWYNTLDGRTYLAYNGQWIDASPVVVPQPSTYLDEITIDGSTININDNTLTISNTGTLLINGTDVKLIDRLTSGIHSLVLDSTGAVTFPDGLTINGTTIGTANTNSNAIEIVSGNNNKLSVGNNSVTIQVPGSGEIRPYWAAEFGGITTAVTTASAAFGTGAFYDSLGNVYVLGAVNYGDQGPFDSDSLLLKYDTNGNLLWSKTWHDDSGANCGAINQAFAIDSNDRIYWLATAVVGGFGCWSGYMDTDGNLGLGGMAQNSLGYVDGHLAASDIACDNSGNYYLAGNYYDDVSFLNTPVVIKIDGDSGTPVWTGNIIPENLKTTFDGTYRAVTVNPTSGDVWAIGDYDDGGLRAILSKWDVNGVHQWTKELVTTTGDLAAAVIYNSGYVYTIVNDDPDQKAVVSKFDTDGVMIWASYLAIGELDPITNGEPFTNTGAYDLSFDAVGNVYVTGTIPYEVGPQLWITKLDPANGEILYSRVLLTAQGSAIFDYGFFGDSSGHRVGDIYEDKLVVTAVTTSDIDDSTSTQALRVITAQLPIDGSTTGTFGNITIEDVTFGLNITSSTGTYTVTTLTWSTGTITTLASTAVLSVSTVTDIVGLTGETIALGSVSGSSTVTNTWTFVNNNIILPPGGDILDSNGNSVLSATTSTALGDRLVNNDAEFILESDGTLTLNDGATISSDMGAFRIEPAGASSATQALLIYPTVADGNHIHLTAGFGGETDLYLGNDDQFVKVDHGGIVVVQTYSTATTTSTWTFGTDGILTLSTASTILGRNSDPNVYIETLTTTTTSTWTFGINGILTLPEVTPVIQGGGTGTDVTIVASTGTNPATWVFGANGGLTFPNNTVQTTAYTGSTSTLVNGTSTVSLSSTGTVTFPDGTVQTTAYSSVYTGWFKAAGTVVQLDTLLARINSTGTMQISSTIVETIGDGAAFAWNGVRNRGATMSAFGQGGTNWVMPGSWLDISATPLNNDFEVATVSVFKLGGTGSLYRITYVGATNDQWSVVIERVAKG
jgi:hypothetical protein